MQHSPFSLGSRIQDGADASRSAVRVLLRKSFINSESQSKMIFETDLAKIKRIARQKEDENWLFRSFLKGIDASSEEIDSIVHGIYQKVSSAIDCRQCANCCKETQPALTETDIEVFSKGLGVSTDQLKAKYLVEGEMRNRFEFKELPCPFLNANLCSNYECRPEDCRSFPHLHKEGFVFRLWGVVNNYSICPIVFNVYEYLKDELWRSEHIEYPEGDDY